MTRPTLASSLGAPKHKGVGFYIGFLIGLVLLAVVNVALSSLTIFIWLNWIGNFGLSFAQVVGLGGILSVVTPTLTAKA